MSRIAGLGMAALLAACGANVDEASAVTSDEAGAAKASEAPELPMEETLLLEPPKAWLRVQENLAAKLRRVTYLPAGQSDEEWSDRLTVESNNLRPLADPIQFLNALGEDLRDQCTESDHRNIHSGLENGYATSVRMLMCRQEKSTGRGWVSLVKAIQGNDNFYVVSRTRRSALLDTEFAPLTRTEMAELSQYLQAVKLCDPRSTEHPCPTQRRTAASNAAKTPPAESP